MVYHVLGIGTGSTLSHHWLLYYVASSAGIAFKGEVDSYATSPFFLGGTRSPRLDPSRCRHIPRPPTLGMLIWPRSFKVPFFELVLKLMNIVLILIVIFLDRIFKKEVYTPNSVSKWEPDFQLILCRSAVNNEDAKTKVTSIWAGWGSVVLEATPDSVEQT